MAVAVISLVVVRVKKERKQPIPVDPSGQSTAAPQKGTSSAEQMNVLQNPAWWTTYPNSLKEGESM